ncbi:hypothetical protein [Oceanithermus sp.]|uniref:glutaredoxin family protein n=1 Tax=Oceanithermus sp. TaxID=2268145 RepID=UPI00257A6D1F|nr:hypothetical protein [Oceanithermus sp.]
MNPPEVVLLTAPGCRRSERVRRAFERAGLPFRELPLDDPEGARIAAEHRILASPGILVCGQPVGVFELFPGCRFDPARLAARLKEVAPC